MKVKVIDNIFYAFENNRLFSINECILGGVYEVLGESNTHFHIMTGVGLEVMDTSLFWPKELCEIVDHSPINVLKEVLLKKRLRDW